MMDLAPGLKLGERFVLVRRLAEGPASQVWLAEDTHRQQRVAVKAIDAARLDAPGMQARLRNELEIARLLPRGTAVEVRGLHEADGLLLLEMEFLPGGDLGQFRGRAFPVFAGVLREVAECLAAAHERGLVHRDLKCSNVLLDDAGHARLADFGLATLTGAVAPGGSPYNASPQQLRGEPARPADDLYAFGAMLYELLAGHPPYYPDVTPDRVLHEPVPPLVPRLPAPERARLLALRLLSKSPAGRPGSIREVAVELAAAGTEPADEQAALQFERDARPVGPRRAGRRRWIVPAAAAGLVAAAIVVFAWLPGQAERRAREAQAEATAAAQAEVERARRGRETAATLARERSEAEQARTQFEQKLDSAERSNAAVWATARLAAAREAQASAAGLFERQEYTAAGSAWNDGSAILDAVAEGRLAALAAALEAGQQALDAGQSATADEAFRLALAIDAEDATAKSGRERAGKLDAVLALLERAGRDERSGRLGAAREGYREALALDPQTAAAQEGLARTGAALAGEAYAATMSRGLQALAAGRDREARAAFEQAQAMRPEAAEPRAALARLDAVQHTRRLEELADRALAAEQAERWPEARDAWAAALELEPTLVSAQAGLDRVVPRLELEARLDRALASPEELWSQDGRDAARNLIASAGAVAPPRARLDAKASRLRAMIGEAETPVSLPLESDGATDVVIYRVGRLGAFERRAVSLLPGRYAVVGTRSGYRDVRLDVVVQPGSRPAPVVVRCEEPL